MLDDSLGLRAASAVGARSCGYIMPTGLTIGAAGHLEPSLSLGSLKPGQRPRVPLHAPGSSPKWRWFAWRYRGTVAAFAIVVRGLAGSGDDMAVFSLAYSQRTCHAGSSRRSAKIAGRGLLLVSPAANPSRRVGDSRNPTRKTVVPASDNDPAGSLAAGDPQLQPGPRTRTATTPSRLRGASTQQTSFLLQRLHLPAALIASSSLRRAAIRFVVISLVASPRVAAGLYTRRCHVG